jgi:hypothetical protein
MWLRQFAMLTNQSQPRIKKSGDRFQTKQIGMKYRGQTINAKPRAQLKTISNPIVINQITSELEQVATLYPK